MAEKGLMVSAGCDGRFDFLAIAGSFMRRHNVHGPATSARPLRTNGIQFRVLRDKLNAKLSALPFRVRIRFHGALELVLIDDLAENAGSHGRRRVIEAKLLAELRSGCVDASRHKTFAERLSSAARGSVATVFFERQRTIERKRCGKSQAKQARWLCRLVGRIRA